MTATPGCPFPDDTESEFCFCTRDFRPACCSFCSASACESPATEGTATWPGPPDTVSVHLPSGVAKYKVLAVTFSDP